MRVRNFVQDDGHIFCSEDQVQSEVSNFIDLVFDVYKTLGFDTISIKLSTRPEKRVGSDEVWDKSEKALQEALENKNLEWELYPGEGAFYQIAQSVIRAIRLCNPIKNLPTTSYEKWKTMILRFNPIEMMGG